MNDPERLLEGGSELERELLGLLSSERPSASLSRRMRQSLVALGVLTAAKTSVAGIVALVSVVSVGAGAIWAVQHRQVEVRHWSEAHASTAVSRAVASRARVVTLPSAPPPPAMEASPPPSRASAPATAPSSAANDLREQIALLDRARAAVRARDSGRALAELSAYGKRFPRGEFSQEVSVLKIEALVQNGQMDAARALGRRFLTAHPESPHVERIERMIGAAR